jgi:hypothetical protein
MSEIAVKRYGENSGIAFVDSKAYTTFSILGAESQLDIADAENDIHNNVTVLGDHFNLNGFTIASHGHHNNLPNEVKRHVKYNAVLPELLKKQCRIMYGHGIGLYKDTDEGNPVNRQWVDKKLYADVFKWLNSWDRDPELEPSDIYLKNTIQEYFYMEGLYNQWFYNKSRRIGGSYGLPVRGLKHKSGSRCRLAKNGTIPPSRMIKDEDCDTVLYTDWRLTNMMDIDIYPRFDRSNPFKYNTAINYVRDSGFDELIYSEPIFYAGLKDWITGANRNPKYINSFLKDSLSARLHVKIPNAWIEKNAEELRSICKANYDAETNSEPLTKEYGGVSLVADNGKALKFTWDLVEQLLNKKIADITSVMSGAGKNQGKTFWSRSFRTEYGVEEWVFEEIPLKYSEFVKSLLDYNSTANKLILAGKGIDPAISNIGNEGVFNSGAQVYYSYLVYLDTQCYAEEFILKDLNRALYINFPKLEDEMLRFGFKRFAPPRQQDVTPANRMDNNQQPTTNN